MMFKMLQHLRWIVVGLVTIVLFHGVIENSAAEEWEVISQLPTKRSAFSTAVVDDKIYLIGGNLFENRKGPFGVSLVEIYNPENNSWRRGADMPTARAKPATAVIDGRIYVIGGYAGIDNRGENFKILKIVEVYDSQTDTWDRKQDMTLSRFGFGIGVVKKKIYVMGGKNPFEDPWRLDRVEIYDPASDRWAERANMPTIRSDVETAVVRDTIYVIAGSGWPHDGQGGPKLATIETYHPRTKRWQKKPDMPNLKTAFSTVVVDDEIYLIGGHGGVGFEKYLTTVEVYDPETERWDEGPPMPAGNIPFDAAAVNGKIYILGSHRENREFSLDVEVFDTGFRAVTANGKLPTRWSELKAEYHGQSQRD